MKMMLMMDMANKQVVLVQKNQKKNENDEELEDETADDKQKREEKERRRQDREKFLKSVSGRIATFLKQVPRVLEEVQRRRAEIRPKAPLRHPKVGKAGKAGTAKAAVAKASIGVGADCLSKLPKAFIVEYRRLFALDADLLCQNRGTLETLKGEHSSIKSLNKHGGKDITAAEGTLETARRNVKCFDKMKNE